MPFPKDLHLFCRVVDNFGDIGVCWRLARQWVAEHGLEVTLWVDDLASFRKICGEIVVERDWQQAQGVIVRRWSEHFDAVTPGEIADVVIEAFACELPTAYVAVMAAREKKPVWINLEYLSAEAWVEGCHRMASRHPSLPLTKHFFFPGFSSRTGGLPAEKDLERRRIAFQQDPGAKQEFFSLLGMQVPLQARKLSLFCYAGAPVRALFETLQNENNATVCLVPEGVAADAVESFLQAPARAGTHATRGALTVQVLPFVDQPDYDKLLWACDLNFVRGEDSFVRAQWAARPFIWHIYPQEQDAHWNKLDAFLAHYQSDMPDGMANAVSEIWRSWNRGGDVGMHWHSFMPVLQGLSRHAHLWSAQLAKNGGLASNLIQFAREIS